MSLYVKIPKLKNIIEDPNIECEKKLDDIRVLVDGGTPKPSNFSRPSSLDSPGVSLVPPVPNDKSETASTEERFSRVLKEINGAAEKRAAESLLIEIEKSEVIKWDPVSLEIQIDDTPVQFTNISHLIKRVVTSYPASLPIGTVLFCEALLRIQAPLNYIHNGDIREIVHNLTRINEAKNTVADPTGSVSEPTSEAALAEAQDSSPGEADSRKRGRDADGDDGGEDGGEDDSVRQSSRKRLRSADSVRRTFDLPPNRLDKIRRSPRLKKEIQDAWKNVRTTKSRKRKS